MFRDNGTLLYDQVLTAPSLGAPVLKMLDVTPANCCDELDVVDAARLKPVKFHTSKETSFCWTLNGSSRRSVFWWTRSLALRDDMLVRLTITLLELLRVEKIVLPPVYISARVNILHGPSWNCVEELEDVTNCH